jgi:WD40 repeat protein
MNRILWLACLACVVVSPLEAKEPELRKTLNGHDYCVEFLAFSHGGKTLVSASGDEIVKVWNVATGESVATFEVKGNDACVVAMSSAGNILAAGGVEGEDNRRGVSLRDMDTYKKTAFIDLDREFASAAASNVSTIRMPNAIYALAFNPNGDTLAVGAMPIGMGSRGGSFLMLWDIAKRKTIAAWMFDEVDGAPLAFSPDGKTLAFGSGSDVVKLWDVATGKQTNSFAGHKGGVASIAFSPNGKMLAVAPGNDTDMKIWDIASGKNVATLKGRSVIFSVAFSPDGKTLASASPDRTIRLWDVNTRNVAAVLKGHEFGAVSVAFSPDGKTLASGGADKKIKLWDVSDRAEKAGTPR